MLVFFGFEVDKYTCEKGDKRQGPSVKFQGHLPFEFRVIKYNRHLKEILEIERFSIRQDKLHEKKGRTSIDNAFHLMDGNQPL